MIKLRSRLTTKLLLFVFTVSFLLIAGSFAYFYLSGKSFINDSSIKELQNYSKRFNQSVKNQIDLYSNNISSLIINASGSKDIEQIVNKNLQKILMKKTSKIDEVYIQYGDSKKSICALPITVLRGEQIINSNIIQNKQFDSLFNSINITQLSNNNSEFGFIKNKLYSDYYIRKKIGLFAIIIKIANLSFYENILENIYSTEEINFCLSNSNEIINYSTNKFWINQKIDKYFSAEQYKENFFKDDERKIIYGKWLSENLGSEVIISHNILSAYDSFKTLLINLLFYSIFIYALIVLFTLFYANRISKSLNKITDITRKVGEGNFEKKIELKRNDEVGLLIDSFNNMIHELKTSYSKLSLSNEELRVKIDELTQARIELSKKQKLAFVGETVSKISHEIQNKISGVSVWVQNLEMQTYGDKNISLYVNEIKSSLTSFMEMLQNFKKFYRKPYLEKRKVDFIKIVENVIKKYNSDIYEKKIKVDDNFILEEKEFELDENLMEEVIENLLVNAIYFSPENSLLQIEVVKENSNIILTICDEGPGISEENSENIFHPFFTTKSSGSGLGLAIAKNIVEAHDGSIVTLKKKSKGACFKIILPIN
ncbi:MAG: HAMP domain-containing histidine kinase [Ignavibacteriae bacterium]|nr:HAMP domain-containing histidine kinase [Ignavibacteriota bacterium]